MIVTTADGPESHNATVATPAPTNTPVVSRRAESAFAATSWAGELANQGSSASRSAFGAARVNPSTAIRKKQERARCMKFQYRNYKRYSNAIRNHGTSQDALAPEPARQRGTNWSARR
jgi:hypothetical protein